MMKYRHILTLLTIMLPAEGLAGTRHYSVPMGQERWEVSSNRLNCGLSYTIADYGKIVIRYKHASKPKLSLTSWKGVNQTRSFKVIARSPVWKRDKQQHVLGSGLIHKGKPSLKLDSAETQSVLGALDAGKLAQFVYQSDTDELVKVDLSSVNFKAAYSQYTQCVGGLLPFPYSSIAFNTIQFENNSHEVGDRARHLLNKVKDYILADQSIIRIRIDGYTDDSGRYGLNNYLSELRAKAVADYLIGKGIPEQMLRVTWHGAKKPVAENDTAQGKAMNRRVTVRLIN